MKGPSRFLRKLRPTPKVFFIGFNKCGTTSFHKFFKANGYLSAHARARVLPTLKRRHIPLIWADNVAKGANPLRGISHYQIFSGISHADEKWVVEGNSFYRELHQAYPDAYFVFNTRPVDAWVKSRKSHRNGRLLAQHAAARGLTIAEIEAAWRTEQPAFEAEVKSFFVESPRFTVFDISKDKISALVQFLASDFALDEGHWKHLNQTTKT